MCAANEAMPRLAASRLDTVAKGFECSMCESTVQAMQQALEDGDEADVIEEDARTACKELPSSFRDFCIDYVNEEGLLLIAINMQILSLETSRKKQHCLLRQSPDYTIWLFEPHVT